MIRIVRVAAVALMSFVLVACGTTQQDRANNADQMFGEAKVALNIATLSVAAYNSLCISMILPDGVCVSNIREIVNSTLAVAADVVVRTERVFAAGNTEGVKLDAAKLAMQAVVELTDALTKYGISKMGQT